MSMFSTVDYESNRTLRVTVVTESDSGLASLPDSSVPSIKALRRRASPDELEDLASELVELDWARSGQTLQSGSGEPAVSVRIELVNVYIEGDDVRERTIAEVAVDQ